MQEPTSSRQISREGPKTDAAPQLTGGGGGIGFWWEAGQWLCLTNIAPPVRVQLLLLTRLLRPSLCCKELFTGAAPGVVKYLQQRYPSSMATWQMRGASAGALTATLAACNVDMDRAYESAKRLAEEHKLFERALGLTGALHFKGCPKHAKT